MFFFVCFLYIHVYIAVIVTDSYVYKNITLQFCVHMTVLEYFYT